MIKKISAKCSLFLLLLLFNCFHLFAQEKVVSGSVSGNTGETLPGVSVNVKGTSKSVITDSKGAFSITVPSDQSVLEFTYVGFASREVKVGNKASLSISLHQSNEKMDEVVVVGYGTRKKSDVTGAISQLKPNDINAVATSNVAEALQGRAAGVAVLTNNAPGSKPVIRIRGSGSITAGNDPLLVVDGFPLENGNLADINSDDIASIEILKDASSTAIYGSRGANGVIMITTKKGSAGKNNVTVSSMYGIQTPARLIKMLGRDQFVGFINDAYQNQIGKPVYNTTNPAPEYNTDWQDGLLKDRAPIQNYTLGFNGGNEKTKYLLSAGMFSQEGLLLGSGFKRYTLRTNLDHKVNNQLTIGTHIQLNNSVRDFSDPGIMNIFRYGWPTMPIKKADGSFYYAIDDPLHKSYVEGRWNPVADAGQITDKTDITRILGDVYAEIKLTDHLSFRTNFGADLSNSKQYYYATSLSTNGWNVAGRGRQTYGQEKQLISENMFTYDNKWADHNLTATAVYSYQAHVFSSATMSGSGFPSDITGYNNVAIASVQDIPSSEKYSNKLSSFTGRASYSYASKYLLTLTGRYDGSSRFGTNKKWGFFPSLGLGWNVSEEKFMTSLSPVVSNLKLRGSIGLTGNQEIGNYKSLASFSSTYYTYNNTNLLLGLIEGLGNPDLKWEKTRQIDAGIDLSLWKNKIDLTFDYYRRNTSDLLYQVPIPTTSGFTSMLKNIGEVQNQGVELSVNVKVIENKSFKWSVGGNVAKNKNKIISLYGGIKKVLLGDDQGIGRYLVVGDPLNGVYTRKSAGIIKSKEEADALKSVQPFAEAGAEKYVNINGDKVINSGDYVYIGSTEPNFYYGVNTSVSFKRVSLDVFGQGASGLATTNTGYGIIGDYQIQNRNYLPSQYAYDRMWSATNTNGTFPKAGAKEVYFSDKTNGNRKFFLIRNIRLGYSINPKIFRRIPVQGLNVYVNAQNYFTFSNFRGYNPESGDVANPFAKTLLMGLNINF